jgi:hypothetical protein
MTTLVIKDLVLNEELDRNAMANVHGGMLHLTAPVRLPVPEVRPYDMNVHTGDFAGRT